MKKAAAVLGGLVAVAIAGGADAAPAGDSVKGRGSVSDQSVSETFAINARSSTDSVGDDATGFFEYELNAPGGGSGSLTVRVHCLRAAGNLATVVGEATHSSGVYSGLLGDFVGASVTDGGQPGSQGDSFSVFGSPSAECPPPFHGGGAIERGNLRVDDR